jgi:transcriptional regulator with XRE-family HTH domain
MSDLKRQFARRLKTIREERHMTQEELAKAIDRSASFVSSLERGVDAPSFETLEKLAKALSVSVQEFFNFGNGQDISSRQKEIH